MLIDRRTLVGTAVLSTAALAVAPFAAADAAEPAARLFDGTPLATNPAARMFRRVDMALPDIRVETAAGRTSLAGIGGKARLLSLWAEWCVPCLVEIRDFAALRPKVATDRFDIGLVLTASTAKLDRGRATARLRPLGAAALPLLVEPNGGRSIAEAVAVDDGPRPAIAGAKPGGFSLPCTLLVDARGRIRGRAFGAPSVSRPGDRPPLTEEQKAALKRGEPVVIRSQPIDQATKDKLMADGKTLWASPAAEAFLRALGDGLLDRV